MTDTKKVERVVRAKLSEDSAVATFTVKDTGTVTATLASIPEGQRPYLMLQGLMTICQGAYSRVEDLKEKLDAISKTVASVLDGSFEPGRAGSAETPSIILALHEVLTAQGKTFTIEEVEERYEAKDKTQKSVVARDPAVMIARARIDREREKARLATAKTQVKEGKTALADF